MMIPKERLASEDVRATVEQILREHLKLNIDGYKCDLKRVVNVLVKAALDGQTIESVCADLDVGVGSNTIRVQLNRALAASDLRQQEVELNAALAACIPAELPRGGREMALDWHDEPFWGKTPELQTYACRGEASEGTTRFYRLASVYVIWRQVRVTLAVTYVLPEDSRLVIVQRLMQRLAHLQFRPKVLYLDKGFCAGPVIRYLTDADLPAIIACPIRGRTGGTRALCRGRRGYCTSYTFTDGTTVQLTLMPARRRDKAGKCHVLWLAYVLVHLDWPPQKVYQRYRRRFGIESSYRQFNRLHARTASRNPALRFLLLGLGFLLLNSWVMLRLAATRVIGRGPARWREPAFRLQRYIAFLRRAIESAFNAIDSIPIYSW